MLKGANVYCVYMVLREVFIVALTKCFYSKLDNVVCCSFWCTWILLYLGSFNNHQLGFLSAKRTFAIAAGPFYYNTLSHRKSPLRSELNC